MAKFINDSVMDAALQWIIDNTTNLSACGTQPTTCTQAATTYCLGSIAWGAGNWESLTNGDSTGRKLTTKAATITVAASGTVDHIAFYNTGTLVAVGTCAPTAVTQSGTVIFAAFDLDEIRDPS